MANPQLKTSITPMAGGVSANAGTGQINQLTVSGSWTAGDLISIVPTETNDGFQMLLGAGDVTGVVPTFLLTYQKKLNFLAGTNWYFSAIDLPTQFNNFNTAGNSFIELANNFAASENILSLVPFQGRIAVNDRTNIQLWQIAADPTNYSLVQSLQFVTTVAKASVLGIGVMDALFLTDTGVRSLRVLSTTLNAESNDTGSPIDSLIQALLLTCSATEKAAACAVREPSTGLYWLFIKNTMYVFAYYPSVKILAWSQWSPSYQTTDLARVTNTCGGTRYFTLGLQATPQSDDIILGNITNGSSVNSVKSGLYIHVYTTDRAAYITSCTLTDGLAFRGLFTYTAEFTFTCVNNQTTFVPQKFVVSNGQVFVRTSDNIFTYGGSANGTYDNVIGVLETSWLPFDAPGLIKTVRGIDVDVSGSWAGFGSTSYLSLFYNRIFDAVTAPTFDKGNIGWTSVGTHCKLRLQTSGASTAATISELVTYYRENESKGVNK